MQQRVAATRQPACAAAPLGVLMSVVIIRVGTRGSALALWQAQHVKARLDALGHAVTLVPITTTGDRLLDRRLDLVGGKGAFLKEIEEALLARTIDLAVHSLKDVPTTLPPGLRLVAFLERADARDALLSASGQRLNDLRRGAVLGTTSLRRRAQLLARRPDLRVEDLRGNVDTRLRRLREGHCDAIVLALAGLARLGHTAEATEVLDVETVLPAPGQGVIAIECRADDSRLATAVTSLDHGPTARCATAERALLAALGGGCNVPLGAYAQLERERIQLRAIVAREDGSLILRGEAEHADPAELGQRVAEELLARGAAALLAAPTRDLGR
jgi:hydroxymethylbilane synthase